MQSAGRITRPRRPTGNQSASEYRGVPATRLPATAATSEGFRTWARSVPRRSWPRVTWNDGTIRIETHPGDPGFHIPCGALTSLEEFDAWSLLDDSPKQGRITFLGTEVIVDMSPEEMETHNKAKEAVHRTVGNLNEELDIGEFYTDGVALKNESADLNTVPDGSFVLCKTLESGKARLVPVKHAEGLYSKLEGTPDWLLEVISGWSVQKDTQDLRAKYHRARIPEYWLIDARGATVDFQILVWRPKGYVAVRPKDGWYMSRVFGRSFRLERRRNRAGNWRYKLHVK